MKEERTEKRRGEAMQMRLQMRCTRLAQGITGWLSSLQVTDDGYDTGGIRDPLSGVVAGEHYSASHFAWVQLLLRNQPDGLQRVQAAKRALDFHVRTAPDEYAPRSWDYHWDFNNLAFAASFGLLAEKLGAEERDRYTVAMMTWRTNPHHAVNWVAMRSLAAAFRYALLGLQEDALQAVHWLEFVLSAQLADGGIEDVKGQSLPSQYHAYSACLLHMLLEPAPVGPEGGESVVDEAISRSVSLAGLLEKASSAVVEARVRKAVIAAARWLLAICGPDGEMNALGRGQGQIFGYACAVYLFSAAMQLDTAKAGEYRWAAESVLSRMERFVRHDGSLPLVLHTLPDAERAGWYDYHHGTVYNAFAALWLQKAAMLPHCETSLTAQRAEQPAAGVTHLSESGLLVIRGKSYFALFSRGHAGAGYATEAGITPHLLMAGEQVLFRYPQGPAAGKYGEHCLHKGQTANIWAPVWTVPYTEEGALKVAFAERYQGTVSKEADMLWNAPAGTHGSLVRLSEQCWLLRLEAHGTVWERRLTVGADHLEADDAFTLSGKLCKAGISGRMEGNGAVLVRHVNVSLPDAIGEGSSESTFRLSFFSGNREYPEMREQVVAAGGVMQVYATEQLVSSAGKAETMHSGWRLRMRSGAEAGAIPPVVTLSWDPWSRLWKRKQRLMHSLWQRHGQRVSYVEPAVRMTDVIAHGRGLAGSDEYSRRLRRGLRPFGTSMGDGLWVHSPLLPLPFARTFPKIAEVNARLWLRQIGKVVKSTATKEGYILWVYHPSQLEAVEAYGAGASLVVYDWTDDWVAALPDSFSDEYKTELASRQQALLRRADVVFAVSEELARRASEYCPWVHYLPNGTDTATFAPVERETREGRPEIVYLSQITERLDVAMLRELAQTSPQWDFRLIGPVVCDPAIVAPLHELPNVVLTGAMPYAEAAGATARADVCILPHVVDLLTATLDPIKLYDYLATGNPVVSTAVAMHPALREYVHIASDAASFRRAIAAALTEDGAARSIRRQAVMAHSWEARADELHHILASYFGGEPCA